jgi:hypothetical protein
MILSDAWEARCRVPSDRASPEAPEDLAAGAVDEGEGVDRPIRDGDHIAHLDIGPHHHRMVETAWRLGGLNEYEELNLRRRAHTLGFRGHFLTRSRRTRSPSAPSATNAAPGACGPTSTSPPPTPTTTTTTPARWTSTP